MSWHLPKTNIKLTTTDVSLFFGLPILAYSEWRFGTEVLGLPATQLFGRTVSLALFVPGFLDTYVVAAMRRGGKEVGWALGLVVMSVTGGAIAHLYKLTPELKVLASAVFGCMLALVIWRVKTIAHADSPAMVAAKLADARVQELTSALSQARTRSSDLTTLLSTAQQAGQAAETVQSRAAAEIAEQVREHERELTDLQHQHELEVTRLRAQLAGARASAKTPGNVVALHPHQNEDQDEDQETRQASDKELLAVLVPLVEANPAVGRPAAITAVRKAGLACGTQRVRDLLLAAKAQHERTLTTDVDTGDELGAVAVTS